MAQVRVRKRGKTFSFIFEAGKLDGKRKVVEKGGYQTKGEAYKAGVAAYNDFLHGNIGITSESITLKDFITNWLNNVVALNVKPLTMQTYQSLFDRRIAPYLGDIKVQDLTPALLDNWIRKLQKAGYAHKTLTTVRALAHHALDYAVYPAQLINSNPAAYIKIPKNAPKNIVKRTIITPKQFKDLLDKFPFGSPMYIPLLLLYHTGMRISEVLGLTWNDIDFKAKKIKLHQQLTYLKKRGYFFTTLKTESSERYILVDDYLIDELRHWQAQQLANEHQQGDTYICIYCGEDRQMIWQSKCLPCMADKAPLVCTREDGGFVRKGVVTSVLKRENLNAHSFRHTHATMLIESGANAKGVAGRLGHANIQITQNLYTHNTLKLQQETLAIFGKITQANA